MQCTAISIRSGSSGKRCKLRALSGSQYCKHHQTDDWLRAREAPVVDAPGLPQREVQASPGGTPEAPGVGDEIVLLRRQIREAANAGDWESVRRGIDTLCKALRVQHVLEGRAGEGLSGSLAHVLEEVGAELGIPL